MYPVLRWLSTSEREVLEGREDGVSVIAKVAAAGVTAAGRPLSLRLTSNGWTARVA
jgi:hypothetical protein